MAQIFISYADEDRFFAEQVYACLSSEVGISVFMAGLSLKPGEHWPSAIQSALQASDAILFIASEASIGSMFVQQELGGGLFTGKRIIPILLDVGPEKLPGFAKFYQALDLRHSNSPEAFTARLNTMAAAISAETPKLASQGINLQTALVIVAVLLVVYLAVSAKA